MKKERKERKTIIFYLDFLGLFHMGGLTAVTYIIGSLLGRRGMCTCGSRSEERGLISPDRVSTC